jgi:hypothetical protein
MKNWVFLSTHFDDVVLSAGGLVWELARLGERVGIWTICAGDPPAGKPLTEYAQLLHGFWDIGIAKYLQSGCGHTPWQY